MWHENSNITGNSNYNCHIVSTYLKKKKKKKEKKKEKVGFGANPKKFHGERLANFQIVG